ncbi:Heme chaperone HemW OS=Streptomyces violarus OX=67380 GN=FHS41_003526 PE=3 SV=1 [Streptomyces violarus]
MPSALPDGEPVPRRRRPARRHALAGAADRPLGFYLHVPYCATRCGDRDFNTYTATELRGYRRRPRLPRQLRRPR